MKNRDYLSKEIIWNSTDNPEFPYQASHDGEELLVRLNDFPAEQLYTLIADGREIEDFDDWASDWKRAPKPSEKEIANSASAAKLPTRRMSRSIGRSKTFGVSARKD